MFDKLFQKPLEEEGKEKNVSLSDLDYFDFKKLEEDGSDEKTTTKISYQVTSTKSPRKSFVL